MAKQPKKSTEQPVPATANPQKQRALGVNIDEELAKALDAYLKKARPKPSKTAVVEAALEDFLRGKGALPDESPAE